jgi:hypothetical protein
MLFPFLPRNPHLFASPPSSAPLANPEEILLPFGPFRPPTSSLGVDGLEFCNPGFIGLELPPRITATEECAHRECFRMADVTVIHSVVMRATGSTATDVFDAILIPLVRSGLKLPLSWYIFEDKSGPRMGRSEVSTLCPKLCVSATRASSLMIV